MTTIYLLRHGTLAGDSRDRFIGQTDLPLAPDGIAQAKAMAGALRGKGIAAIHCSDLTRSRDTAAVIGDALGLPVTAHAGVNRLLLCRMLGMPVQNMFRLGQDYGCVNILELDRKGIRVRLINGRSANLND